MHKSSEVLGLYTRLDKLGIKIWVDGGWGVDALLGKITRPHKDLDIAIEDKDAPKLIELLTADGYKEIKRDNQWNFVISDDAGRQIDIHIFVVDSKGNITEGILYPKESLTGTGVIDGQTVRCISAQYAIKFHSGYELEEKDYMDVSALCEKFGIDLPAEYQAFKQRLK